MSRENVNDQMLVNIALCVKKMGLPADPNFEKDEHNQLKRRLFIHDMQIKDIYHENTE
jgi:hypothetical protein